MPKVYDDKDQEQDFFNTVIPKEEQNEMSQRAIDGAADDIAKQGGDADEGVSSFFKDQSDVSGSEKPSLDSFYRGENGSGTGLLAEDKQMRGPAQKLRGSLRKRRNKILIAATGSILSAVFGFISFLPLQFTHLAELLTEFNFSVSDEAADSRTTRLIRYLKYQDSPEMRRLSWVGNNVADRLVDRLAKDGTTLKYNGAGFLDEIEVRSNNKRVIDEARKQGIDVDIDNDAGKTRIPLSDTRNSVRKSLLKLSSKEVGSLGPKISSIGTRSLVARAGVGFKVFGNLERGVKETFNERKTRWLERTSERRLDGDLRSNIAGKPIEFDEEGNQIGVDEDVDVKENLDETGEKRKPIIDEPDPKTKLSLGRKALIGGLAGMGAVSVYCEIKNLGEMAEAERWAKTGEIYMRIGMDILVASSQIKLGQLTAEEIGLLTEQIQENATRLSSINQETKEIENEESTGNAFNSNLIQKSLGNDAGAPLPESYNPAPTRILSFIKGLPGLPDPICPALTSVWTGAILTIASLGSLTVANGIIAAALLGAGAVFLDDIARLLAGSGIETIPYGSNFGGAGFIGTHLAANEVEILHGGRQQSPDEVIQNNAWRDRLIAEKNNERNAYERFLSPDNIRSLTMTAALTMPTNWRSSVAKIFTAPFEGVSKIFKPVSAQSLVTAEDIFNYPTYGMTEAQLNSYDDPRERYSIAPDLNRLNREYSGACFGVEIDETAGESGSIQILNSVDYEALEERCELEENETAEVALKYSLYVGDTVTATSLGCYEGVETFCVEAGFGPSTVSSANATSGSLVADPGLVFILGDSISNGARSEYEKQFNTGAWSVYVDAVDGRQLAGDVTVSDVKSNNESLTALRNANAVVIELGANNLSGAGFEELITETINGLREINSSATYYWVDIGSNPTATGNTDENTPAIYSSNNSSIYKLAPVNELNYTVIPWFKEVFGEDQNPTQITGELEPASNYLSDDDLHPNAAGMTALARLVSTIVRGDAVSITTDKLSLVSFKYD